MTALQLRVCAPAAALAVTAVLAAAAPVPATPRSTASTEFSCVASTQSAVSPGATTKISSFRFTSAGKQTSSCTGRINGVEIKQGRAVVTYAGRLHGSCLLGAGTAALTIKAPVRGGGYRVVNTPYTLDYVAVPGGSGAVGTVHGRGLDGSFAFTPSRGDCVSEPLTLANVSLAFTYVR
ncbi:hypothetical protein [Streptomyces wuyuanensis]|uniref:hypothetical protein n=1 Tax=Streptomyces wuyuanensis TaxID=1196353 RepID=UPI0036C0C46A